MATAPVSPKPPTKDSSSAFASVAIAVVVSLASVALVIVLFFKIGWLQINAPSSITMKAPLVGYWLLSAVFGISVGGAEIVSRYRDEPFLTLRSKAGRWYMLLNGAISAAAFFLLIRYPGQIFSSLRQDYFLTSIVAGFGAMIVMRSKLFSFKTDQGETFAIGPEAVLVIFLTSVDRQIDRYRASRRQRLVFDETKDITDATNAPGFLTAFLNSYQNLTGEEKAKIKTQITDAYNSADLPTPLLKLMTVAFGFLNIMGENNFRALMSILKEYQQRPGASQTQPQQPQSSPPSGPPSGTV
jgi:hypothetical protein